MKTLRIFYLKNCPYCIKAFRLLDELLQEAKYHDIAIEKIEESENSELANSYDYYYVPSFYFQDQLLHSGACDKQDLEKILAKVA